MKILSGVLTLFLFSQIIQSQVTNTENQYINITDQLLTSDSKLTIGGYGEVHYNQPLSSEVKKNGTLDVHRIVMLFGYRFNERTQFITELEFEHVKEVYVEQAFLQYKLNNFINFRGGLLLIPMGIINEYHEPTAFNGVERPLVDKYIAPSTWREIGLGINGNIINASLRYQLYVVNGFNGYDGSTKLNGKNGLRKGRQKGAESFISSPNFTGKLEFYGLKGLNLGGSAYLGKTQSTVYNDISKDDKAAVAHADSSVVGVSMLGIDARYQNGGLSLKGQIYYTALSNTDQYNFFAADTNDLGSSMNGYYVEVGYNILHSLKEFKSELIPFVRFEQYNTHGSVEKGITVNPSYKNTLITTGISWKITPGSVVKADMQFSKSDAVDKYSKAFNAGFGVMF